MKQIGKCILQLPPHPITSNCLTCTTEEDPVAEESKQDIAQLSEVKDMVKTMIQCSLDKQDGTGLLYSKKNSEHLEQDLRKEVEATSLQLDELVTAFVNKYLVTDNQE